ncbi:hypothetical protein GBA52_010631 [Prunus armeniaca]|nr:hypothetical protein GBA52_010631 [Prunus armeniaca]
MNLPADNETLLSPYNICSNTTNLCILYSHSMPNNCHQELQPSPIFQQYCHGRALNRGKQCTHDLFWSSHLLYLLQVV